MRKIPITVTLPPQVIKDLHLYISPRKISSFVSEMVAKGLEDKKKLLAREFQEAALDKERNKDIKEWDNLVGTDEGLNESNDYKG